MIFKVGTPGPLPSVLSIQSHPIFSPNVPLNAKKIDTLFRKLSETISTPVSELNYRNHFELLISVILSAQATDVSVNKVTPDLFEAAPTPEAMVALGEDKIRHYIRKIGLTNSKAKNIYNCCKSLVENFNSQVPDTREELESLGGVGRKTAGVILNVAFGKPEIPVDTHVFRVSNRIGLAKAKTPLATEKQLIKVIPEWAGTDAHHLLILHGRYVCKARKPLCEECCIVNECEKNPDPAKPTRKKR